MSSAPNIHSYPPFVVSPHGLELDAPDPGGFFVPPYVGHKGRVGMWLDDEPDWDEVAAVITRSYCLIAPRRLAALVECDRPRLRYRRDFNPAYSIRSF